MRVFETRVTQFIFRMKTAIVSSLGIGLGKQDKLRSDLNVCARKYSAPQNKNSGTRDAETLDTLFYLERTRSASKRDLNAKVPLAFLQILSSPHFLECVTTFKGDHPNDVLARYLSLLGGAARGGLIPPETVLNHALGSDGCAHGSGVKSILAVMISDTNLQRGTVHLFGRILRAAKREYEAHGRGTGMAEHAKTLLRDEGYGPADDLNAYSAISEALNGTASFRNDAHGNESPVLAQLLRELRSAELLCIRERIGEAFVGRQRNGDHVFRNTSTIRRLEAICEKYFGFEDRIESPSSSSAEETDDQYTGSEHSSDSTSYLTPIAPYRHETGHSFHTQKQSPTPEQSYCNSNTFLLLRDRASRYPAARKYENLAGSHSDSGLGSRRAKSASGARKSGPQTSQQAASAPQWSEGSALPESRDGSSRSISSWGTDFDEAVYDTPQL